MMTLNICNASVSFDIEGAQEKLEELTLDNYPGRMSLHSWLMLRNTSKLCRADMLYHSE
jgi:hypothetical protein